MILPGPEATQLATYLGWLFHGRLGGLIAGLLFILPSMVMLIGLGVVYVLYGKVPEIQAIFYGLKPAVVAIVMYSAWKISKKSLSNTYHYVLAIAAFAAMFFFKIPFPLIILATIGISLMLMWYRDNKSNTHGQDDPKIEENERDYIINHFSHEAIPAFSFKSLSKQVAVFAFLWSIPLILCYLLTADFPFWKNIGIFFSKAAFVTIGGAYSVLPYVAQFSVEKFQWLSYTEMIDGLALGETTPGPLIMVLAFVGFMAGYNVFTSSIAIGVAAGVFTVFYTFLPCFLFIFAGAPFVEQSRKNLRIAGILNDISAAVVGVILNLLFFFGSTVLFSETISFSGLDWISLVWIIISFIALAKFQVNMIAWIGVSCIFGWATLLLP